MFVQKMHMREKRKEWPTQPGIPKLPCVHTH